MKIFNYVTFPTFLLFHDPFSITLEACYLARVRDHIPFVMIHVAVAQITNISPSQWYNQVCSRISVVAAPWLHLISHPKDFAILHQPKIEGSV
jgi:hypothetical protein